MKNNDKVMNTEKSNDKKEIDNIKIFVSHRIDQDSQIIDNPIFVPVRCGAFYDKRKNTNMLGDDTGDNISEKRMSFNELTVQYWAWKNMEADYYGLCHYRRYLNFSKCQAYPENQVQLVEEPYLSDDIYDKYGFNQKNIQYWIKKSDIVTTRLFDISKIERDSKYNHYKRYEILVGKTLADYAINLTLDIIKKREPDFYNIAKQHFDSSTAYFCNCFIMKNQIFKEYSEWLFGLLFEIEKQIDFTLLNEKQTRIVGFLSEELFSIYIKFLQKERKYNIKYLQLILFNNTSNNKKILPAFNNNNIPIILAADNLYIKYASVLINSIIKNSSIKSNYDILILETDISSYNKDLIRLLISNYQNFSIRFVNISKEIDKRNFKVYTHYKKYNFYRLVAPDVFINYDKAIYLDSDIVINHDIADLFSIDLENKIIAAVPDIRYHGWNNEENNDLVTYSTDVLKFDKKDLYFNSGVVIYNLKKFRNQFTASYLLDICEKRSWRYVDQDVLNILCKDDVKFLPFNWNVMISCDDYITEQKAPFEMFTKYKEAHENPFIVHYAGNFMPCNVPNVDLFHYFWIYARDTPFYEIFILNSQQPDNSNNRLLIVEKFCRDLEKRTSVAEYKIHRFEKIFFFNILRRIRKILKRNRK